MKHFGQGDDWSSSGKSDLSGNSVYNAAIDQIFDTSVLETQENQTMTAQTGKFGLSGDCDDNEVLVNCSNLIKSAEFGQVEEK